MSSVSIADMERVALGGGDSVRFDSDLGNVIELGDLSDDLGLSMLMNPTKIGGGGGGFSGSSGSGGYSQPQGQERTINFPAYPSSSSSSAQIDISPLEPETIDMNSFGGSPLEVNVMSSPSSNPYNNFQSSTSTGVHLASPARDPEAEKKEKSDYLNKLQRLEQKGFPVARKFTLDNSLEEMKTEYSRLVDARNLETSIKFQRQMLMGAITGMEWLNGRFDPFDVKLDGWSESVHENVEDFDEIFEELYDKYKDRGKMSPEMRLVMAVGGSGFMCHVSNTFFRSKMPSMDDVLRRNPELARQMATAAAQQAGPGFGNFMGMAMGQGQGQGQGQQQVPQQNPEFPGNGGPQSTGAFFGSGNGNGSGSGGSPQKSTARREMSGPSGVDDILKTFEEVRRAELSSSIPQPATGYSAQPAVAAASGPLSVSGSIEEMMSQGESVRTGGTSGRRPGGGGRGRRAQPPVGNTISLNV